MDNIIIKKVYDEAGLIELKVTAISEFVSAYQYCYIQNTDLKDNVKKIYNYTQSFKEDCYIEFGNKQGNYTPAFSMKLLKADMRGHLKIEVDIEIADNDNRAHRCCYYVESELGLIEKFGKNLEKLLLGEINEEIRMCE